uniref:Uncharacterized protein n=1 Tax=Anopheles funestus TaxID=62324 RepID=A0A4Y0BDF9_ANOFN
MQIRFVPTAPTHSVTSLSLHKQNVLNTDGNHSHNHYGLRKFVFS